MKDPSLHKSNRVSKINPYCFYSVYWLFMLADFSCLQRLVLRHYASTSVISIAAILLLGFFTGWKLVEQ
jgi:hypothetical protein